MISLYNITLTSDTNGGLDKVKENIKIDDVAQLQDYQRSIANATENLEPLIEVYFITNDALPLKHN